MSRYNRHHGQCQRNNVPLVAHCVECGIGFGSSLILRRHYALDHAGVDMGGFDDDFDDASEYSPRSCDSLPGGCQWNNLDDATPLTGSSMVDEVGYGGYDLQYDVMPSVLTHLCMILPFFPAFSHLCE
jgi:hypothetical protein